MLPPQASPFPCRRRRPAHQRGARPADGPAGRRPAERRHHRLGAQGGVALPDADCAGLQEQVALFWAAQQCCRGAQGVPSAAAAATDADSYLCLAPAAATAAAAAAAATPHELNTLLLAFPVQGSAEAHTLDSDTSERLQLGLVGLAGAALGVHVLHGGWLLLCAARML